jgi:hypothetical protein
LSPEVHLVRPSLPRQPPLLLVHNQRHHRIHRHRQALLRHRALSFKLLQLYQLRQRLLHKLRRHKLPKRLRLNLHRRRRLKLRKARFLLSYLLPIRLLHRLLIHSQPLQPIHHFQDGTELVLSLLATVPHRRFLSFQGHSPSQYMTLE